MEKMEQEGWAIAEYYKNGKFKCFWCAEMGIDGELEVTGYGELYFTKTRCKWYVDGLNASWGEDRFRCVKAKLVLED